MSDDNDTVDVQAVPLFDPDLRMTITPEYRIALLEAENARLKAAIAEALGYLTSDTGFRAADPTDVLRAAIEAGGE